MNAAAPNSELRRRPGRRTVHTPSAQTVLPTIAVVIPCLNEMAAIGKVVTDFKRALPAATVFVCDNGSRDDTARVAAQAGAIVRREQLKGKGNVVRRMFADIDADVFVLVDGDDTYDASSAPALVKLLLDESLDMVNAARHTEVQSAYRRGHRFGNYLLTALVNASFGSHLKDLLSGYRVFSRRFVKTFPSMSFGFEIETELSVHALHLRMPVAEVATVYRERPAGSASKLHTIRDGLRILQTIVYLIKDYRPLAFFSVIGVFLAALSVVLAVPVVVEFMHTGLVRRFPTAILSASIMVSAFISLVCGLILDAVSRGRSELKHIHYLSIPLRFGSTTDSIERPS